MCKVLLNFPTVYRNKQILKKFCWQHFSKRLQILKQEWQEKLSWDQANRRQKLGLVWRIRKKISQIIKDYFCLPFFLLIILCIPIFGVLDTISVAKFLVWRDSGKTLCQSRLYPPVRDYDFGYS